MLIFDLVFTDGKFTSERLLRHYEGRLEYTHLILFIPANRSCLFPNVLRLNSLCGMEANVTAPIWTLRGPISKVWANLFTKSNCFWKLEDPTDPEESRRNTMSAGLDPQSEINISNKCLAYWIDYLNFFNLEEQSEYFYFRVVSTRDQIARSLKSDLDLQCLQKQLNSVPAV